MAYPEFTTEELESEEWRPVVGIEQRYSISSLGRIRNSQRLLSPHLCRDRYIITLSRGSRRRVHPQIHCLVAFAFIGPRPAGYEINHKDGKPGNNRLSNLEYVTPSENMRHAYKMGLHVASPGVPKKLSSEDVKMIMVACQQGESYAAMGRKLGVSDRTVSSAFRKLHAYAHD